MTADTALVQVGVGSVLTGRDTKEASGGMAPSALLISGYAIYERHKTDYGDSDLLWHWAMWQ